jgi:S-formylglutathione hydrolase
MTLPAISQWKSFGGELSVHDHVSAVLGCTMRFAVYVPPQAARKPVPVLWYLSGLTCTWANVMEKSGIQRAAAHHGVMIIAPDTSPRGDHVADDAAHDLGQGAGFYLTATAAPWAAHYKMDQYLLDELQPLIGAQFPADMSRQGIMGHSMGGHGALTLHFRHPERFRSCSAFSPITSPSQVPWGQKAFTAYLGPPSPDWAAYDATALVTAQTTAAHLLIDTGKADPFLVRELKPEIFIKACIGAGQALDYRMQAGYGHDYFFVASFIDEHIAHHARALGA